MEYLKLFETHQGYEDFVSGGTMVRPNVSHCIQENEVHYNPYVYDYSQDYLTFVALEDEQFGFSPMNNDVISYSLDNGETWTELEAEQSTQTITAGNKIMWKSMIAPQDGGIGTFNSSGRFDVQGNVMSLLYGDNFKEQVSLDGKNNAFESLFSDCGIVNARNLILPATTLAYGCYMSMFRRCGNLTTTPQLPATTLANSCYRAMFYDCTSLTTAPELPATTLAQQCYQFMFEDCTSLTTAPVLPATTLAEYCYGRMFTRCTSLTTAPVLPATTLTEGCYGYMFASCTSLTTAPVLPATTLTTECYANMFEYCTSLTAAPELPATTLVESCYSSMFYGCTSLTNIAVVPNTVKPVGGEYCCGMYALTNIQQSPDYDASAWSDEC